jgi:hypothetical protein
VPALRVIVLLPQNAPSAGSAGAPFGTVRTAAVNLATVLRCAESIKRHSTLYADHSRDGRVHRPVPGLPAGWVRLLAIARLLSPSITNYTSMTKVQVQNKIFMRWLLGFIVSFLPLSNLTRTGLPMSCLQCYSFVIRVGVFVVSSRRESASEPNFGHPLLPHED